MMLSAMIEELRFFLHFLQHLEKDMNERYIWNVKLFRGFLIVTYCYKCVLPTVVHPLNITKSNVQSINERFV